MVIAIATLYFDFSGTPIALYGCIFKIIAASLKYWYFNFEII